MVGDKMIRIFLGNIGSGKTISYVREMMMNLDKKKTYTNIRPTKKSSKIVTITADMIIKKEHVRDIKKRDGSIEPQYEISLNKDFWTKIKEPINVGLDEVHNMMNARRFMSRQNDIMMNWMAMVRRVLENGEGEGGELTLITQLPNRIDKIARDMATHVRYHICHYNKRCLECGAMWCESSESAEKLKICPRCFSPKIKRFGHMIEVFKFRNMKAYTGWSEFGEDSFYARGLIHGIEKYFPMYNTLQWEDLFQDVY